MANITVTNRPVSTNNYIGAVICRTPKTLNDTVDNNVFKDNKCVLLTSPSQLIDYFGDPYINPSEYAELIIAYRLVQLGYPVYVSSVDDMRDFDDGFNTHYNGYTEFYFRDSNKHRTIGYKLKSNLKFCQAIIQSDYNKGIDQLDLYVSLYLMRRDILKGTNELNRVDQKQLYNTYHLALSTVGLTDAVIINALNNLGLELKVLNGTSDTSLVDEFKRFTQFRVSLDFNSDSLYEFDLHNDSYVYDLATDQKIFSTYMDAIDRLKSKSVVPNFICLSKLYRSVENIIDGHIARTYTIDLDADCYPVIYNYLMSVYDEDSDTYLFINAPDVPLTTAIDFFSAKNDYKDIADIPLQYNCDAFYGYAGDYILNSLYYPQTVRVYYSASLLTFYNLMYNQSNYLTNGVGDLNASCDCVKSIIDETSAESLISARCNSVVTFDKGYPSIYGDRSLSDSPNLQFSHIARNFVYIRRLIRDYVESLKFTLNASFNFQLAANRINRDILDSFVDAGILSYYHVEYNIVNNNTVEFTIDLQFNGVIESITLNFTI